MNSIGTFGSYTQARLAIYASQAGLSVTGNNIANINTFGYTRQRLEQSSFYAGGADRYYSSFGARTGNGVLCTGVSQLRDPYLDIRYRSQMSNVGAMDAKLGGLEGIRPGTTYMTPKFVPPRTYWPSKSTPMPTDSVNCTIIPWPATSRMWRPLTIFCRISGS